MQKNKKEILLSKTDYHIITAVLKDSSGKKLFNRKEAEKLEQEIKAAKVLNEETMPPGVVQLYSYVKVKDATTGKILELSIVPPGKADIRRMKISVLSPMGTALLGYSGGQRVQWMVPSGMKTFLIQEVKNQPGK